MNKMSNDEVIVKGRYYSELSYSITYHNIMMAFVINKVMRK